MKKMTRNMMEKMGPQQSESSQKPAQCPQGQNAGGLKSRRSHPANAFVGVNRRSRSRRATRRLVQLLVRHYFLDPLEKRSRKSCRRPWTISRSRALKLPLPRPFHPSISLRWRWLPHLLLSVVERLSQRLVLSSFLQRPFQTLPRSLLKSRRLRPPSFSNGLRNPGASRSSTRYSCSYDTSSSHSRRGYSNRRPPHPSSSS